MSSSAPEKRKELKLEVRHVITPEQVMKNERQARLLQVIQAYGDISEKGLIHLVYELKEHGIELGYTFSRIGNVITSKQLKDDILALLYVGFVETVGRAKKLRLTSMGQEALQKLETPAPEEIKKGIEKVRAKIAAIDAEIELQHLSKRK
uniref:Uncharacterized protein n=1 Tax=Fervidicoccus fontis TaxID=683846 RepID=A0A7J3ZLG8_9CREN